MILLYMMLSSLYPVYLVADSSYLSLYGSQVRQPAVSGNIDRLRTSGIKVWKKKKRKRMIDTGIEEMFIIQAVFRVGFIEFKIAKMPSCTKQILASLSVSYINYKIQKSH